MRGPALVLALTLLAIPISGCQASAGNIGLVASNGTIAAAGGASNQRAEITADDRFAFQPNTVTAHVGTLTLRLRDAGQTPFSLDFDDRGFASIPTVSRNTTGSVTVTFTSAGTYAFRAPGHPGMTGQVVVS